MTNRRRWLALNYLLALCALVVLITTHRPKAPKHHTWTLVQSAVNNSCGAASSCAIGAGQSMSTTGTGHVIVLWLVGAGIGSGKFSSVAGGASYAECPTGTNQATCLNQQAACTCETDMWYTLNTTSGVSTITATWTTSITPTQFGMAEFSYTGTSPAVDASGTIYNSTNTNRGGVALTTTGANDLGVQVLGMVNTSETPTSLGSPSYASFTAFTAGGGAAGIINTTNGTAPTWVWTPNTNIKTVGSAIAISEVLPATGSGGIGGNSGVGGKGGVGE